VPDKPEKKDIIQAYKTVFGHELATLVLKELELFTGYHGVLFFPDSATRTAFALGCREVYKHIQEMINTNFDDLKPKTTGQ
jgi:hypothetical protein